MLFHYSWALWRRVQKEENATPFSHNKNFNSAIRFIIFWAFVRSDDVKRVYIKVKQWTLNKEVYELSEFFDNFEKTI